MNMDEVSAILRSAQLPALNQEQLLSLVNIGESKGFETNLRLFHAGIESVRQDLELIVRSLSPKPRAVLAKLGYLVTLGQLIELAKSEKMRLFLALHAIHANKPQREQAIAYIKGLGLKPAPATPPAVPKSKGPVEAPYYNFKIHGSAAVLCISEARTRTGNLHTIQIEGAGALGDGSLTYDWPNKIIVQLQTSEAYLLLALLEQKITAVRFEGHGVAHTKILQVQYQEKHYFVRMTDKGKKAVAVQVRPVDAIPIVALLYKQLQLNEPHLAIKDIEAMVDRAASMMAV